MGSPEGTGSHLHREEESGKMKGYRTFKTTMGHKVRVRMSDDEIAERELFHILLILFPFLTGVFMACVWFGRW